jgi:hypothetical protein
MATRPRTRPIPRILRRALPLLRNQRRDRIPPPHDAQVQAGRTGPVRVQLCGDEDAGDEGDGAALAEFEDEGDAGEREAGGGAQVSGGTYRQSATTDVVWRADRSWQAAVAQVEDKVKMGLDYLEKGEGKALVDGQRVKAVIASGGVASNQYLRKRYVPLRGEMCAEADETCRLGEMLRQRNKDDPIRLVFPPVSDDHSSSDTQLTTHRTTSRSRYAQVRPLIHSSHRKQLTSTSR